MTETQGGEGIGDEGMQFGNPLTAGHIMCMFIWVRNMICGNALTLC
jgi:hypothetical protein